MGFPSIRFWSDKKWLSTTMRPAENWKWSDGQIMRHEMLLMKCVCNQDMTTFHFISVFFIVVAFHCCYFFSLITILFTFFVFNYLFNFMSIKTFSSIDWWNSCWFFSIQFPRIESLFRRLKVWPLVLAKFSLGCWWH